MGSVTSFNWYFLSIWLFAHKNCVGNMKTIYNIHLFTWNYLLVWKLAWRLIRGLGRDITFVCFRKPDALYFMVRELLPRRRDADRDEETPQFRNSHLNVLALTNADCESYSYIHSPVTSQFSNLTVISSGEELLNIFNVSSYRRNLAATEYYSSTPSADVKLIFFKPDLSLLEDIARSGHLCLHSSDELQNDIDEENEDNHEQSTVTSDSSIDIWYDAADTTPAAELGGSHPQWNHFGRTKLICIAVCKRFLFQLKYQNKLSK